VGTDAITRSLIELKSSDKGKQKRALDRLQRAAPDGRAVQVAAALVPLLEDDDGLFVSDVVKTLAVWRSPEAMEALIGRMRDNRHFVRSDAIKALGKYQDPRAAEAIVTVIKEDGFAVEDALKSMGEVAEPAVVTLLRSPDSHVRGQACRILAQIGGQKTLIEMQSLPADPDFGVRMAAQDAWKRIVARVGPPPRPARGKTGSNLGKATGR
jgi:HEAT repeat protein